MTTYTNFQQKSIIIPAGCTDNSVRKRRHSPLHNGILIYSQIPFTNTHDL